MKHLLLIDPLEKLQLSKDSTLLLAHTLREQGHEVSLLFEDDFHILSDSPSALKTFEFSSSLKEGDFYLKSFSLKKEKTLLLNDDILFHIRLDPPFDRRYLKYLWMMNSLKHWGVKFLNDPAGLLLFNEKITAFQASRHLETYVGSSWEGLMKFVHHLEAQGHNALIFKPLDLYQGIGVEKALLKDKAQLKGLFKRKILESQGAILVQPFVPQIAEGEIRTVFFGKRPLGTILKVPPKGAYLANIIQGAKYSAVALETQIQKECERLYELLRPHGLHWLAYDVLHGHINEVNITCPGLLVEVSSALKKNVAIDLIEEINHCFP